MTWICNVLYRFMDYDAVNDSQVRADLFMQECGCFLQRVTAAAPLLSKTTNRVRNFFRDAIHNCSVSHAAV